MFQMHAGLWILWCWRKRIFLLDRIQESLETVSLMSERKVVVSARLSSGSRAKNQEFPGG